MPSGSSTHTKKKICKTCSLILVADYEFFRDVGRGSVSKAKKKKTLRVHQSQSCLVDIFTQFAKEVFILNKGIQFVFQKFHCRLLLWQNCDRRWWKRLLCTLFYPLYFQHLSLEFCHRSRRQRKCSRFPIRNPVAKAASCT